MSNTTTWPNDAPPPDAIPDLLLLRRIGQGGFGEVWLAENRTTGRLTAVKLVRLKASGPASPAIKEIQALSRVERNRSVKHANLLTIHHVGKTCDYLYYTMDPADDVTGGPASRSEDYMPATLRTRLRTGRLPADECLHCARQLLDALACLHREGLVHRDVKPDNCIFLDGELKLADFGLVTDADGSISLAGTLKYMPRDLTMDAQADVYAAGLVIYEMYSGNPVDRFPSLVPNGEALLSDPRLVALNRVVLRAADPARENRYVSAQQMMADLQEALSRQAESASGVKVMTSIKRLAWTVWPARRRSAAITLGCLLLLGLAVTSLWLAWFKPLPTVDVNFITEPFGAQVVLDGSPLEWGSGPYVTPCTIPSLTAEIHRVVFRHRNLGDVDAGAVDFARVREVTARWPTRPAETAASPNP